MTTIPELLEALARSVCLAQIVSGKCVCFSCEAQRILDRSGARVIITVQGGCAEVHENTGNVPVEILDFDEMNLCPICGEMVKLQDWTKDGRLIADCKDAFTVAQWQSEPRN